MAKLLAKSVFEQRCFDWPGLKISTVYSHEWVSIAAHLGQTQQMGKHFKKAYGSPLPKPTQFLKTNNGFVGWTGQDQWLMQIEDSQDQYADNTVAAALIGTASVTLQSDAWVALKIDGEKTADLLERLIALDTSETAFPAGSMARTQMHHMGVLLLRHPNSENHYRLMSARSSAQSFLHAVTQTAQNICGGVPVITRDHV